MTRGGVEELTRESGKSIYMLNNNKIVIDGPEACKVKKPVHRWIAIY